jgi:hypothetical protein
LNDDHRVVEGGGNELDKERLERKRARRFAKLIEKHELEDDEILERLELDHDSEYDDDQVEDKIVSIDLDLRFKDLKAHVPVRSFLSLPPQFRGELLKIGVCVDFSLV